METVSVTLGDRSFLKDLKVGDRVERLLSAARIPMPLTVTNIHEGLIHCGPWVFDQKTGIEEDPECGMGTHTMIVGSWLERKLEDDVA